MNIDSVADGLLIAVAVVWILLKQVRSGPGESWLLVIVPGVMAYFGLTTTPARTWSDSTDLLLIGLGAVISIAIGIPRGATIRVWRGEGARWWRQGSNATLALWGALLVARGTLYGLDKASGHPAAVRCGASPTCSGPQFRLPERRYRAPDAPYLLRARHGGPIYRPASTDNVATRPVLTRRALYRHSVP